MGDCQGKLSKKEKLEQKKEQYRPGTNLDENKKDKQLEPQTRRPIVTQTQHEKNKIQEKNTGQNHDDREGKDDGQKESDKKQISEIESGKEHEKSGNADETALKTAMNSNQSQNNGDKIDKCDRKSASTELDKKQISEKESEIVQNISSSCDETELKATLNLNEIQSGKPADEAELKSQITSKGSSANFGYQGPNFSKGTKPSDGPQSFPNIDGAPSMPQSNNIQTSSRGTGSHSTKVIPPEQTNPVDSSQPNQQGNPIMSTNNSTHGLVQPSAAGTHGPVQSSAAGTLGPEQSSAAGTHGPAQSSAAGTYGPVQPSSAQNTPPSGNTDTVASKFEYENAGPEFAEKEEKYEDEEYLEFLKGQDQEEFTGFKKTGNSKPSTKQNVKEQKKESSEDDEVTESDESDDTESEESSSDDDFKMPQPSIQHVKRGKVEITNVKNAQFAAIGSHAKYIDMRKMPQSNSSDRKKKGKNKKKKPKETDKNKTPAQHNTEKTKVSAPSNLPVSHHRVRETERIKTLEVIVKAAKSVGILHGPHTSGTVFRVGDLYVMTAYHVVKGLIEETYIGDDGKTRTYMNEPKLKSSEIFVDFNYHSHTVSSSNKFSLEDYIDYHNDDLDVAVLKLQVKEHEEFPPPLTHFVIIDPNNYKKPIYLVGHPGGQPKEEDPKIQLWNPYPWRINQLREWSQKEFSQDGYSGITHPQKFVFECSFRHGASGGPGISPGMDDNPEVVTMLLRGFPDFYYFDNFTEEERNRVSQDKLKQQGVQFKAVMEDMRQKNLSLFHNIFKSQIRTTLGNTTPHFPENPIPSAPPRSPVSSPTTEGPSSLATSSGVHQFGQNLELYSGGLSNDPVSNS